MCHLHHVRHKKQRGVSLTIVSRRPASVSQIFRLNGEIKTKTVDRESSKSTLLSKSWKLFFIIRGYTTFSRILLEYERMLRATGLTYQNALTHMSVSHIHSGQKATNAITFRASDEVEVAT